jgi:hypothetical protein
MRDYQRSDDYGLGLLVFVIFCLVGAMFLADHRYWFVLVPLLLLALVGAYVQWGRRDRAARVHDDEHTADVQDRPCRWCHREYVWSQMLDEREQVVELARERLLAKNPPPKDDESA